MHSQGNGPKSATGNTPFRATTPESAMAGEVYRAGDHLLYPSFQGAYDSGVQAAETILKRNAHGEPHGANS